MEGLSREVLEYINETLVDFVIRHGFERDLTADECDAPRVIFLDDTKEFVVSRGDGTWENVTREINSLQDLLKVIEKTLGQKASVNYVNEQIAKAQLEGAGVDTSQFVMQSDLEKVTRKDLEIVKGTRNVHIFNGGVQDLVVADDGFTGVLSEGKTHGLSKLGFNPGEYLIGLKLSGLKKRLLVELVISNYPTAWGSNTGEVKSFVVDTRLVESNGFTLIPVSISDDSYGLVSTEFEGFSESEIKDRGLSLMIRFDGLGNGTRIDWAVYRLGDFREIVWQSYSSVKSLESYVSNKSIFSMSSLNEIAGVPISDHFQILSSKNDVSEIKVEETASNITRMKGLITGVWYTCFNRLLGFVDFLKGKRLRGRIVINSECSGNETLYISLGGNWNPVYNPIGVLSLREGVNNIDVSFNDVIENRQYADTSQLRVVVKAFDTGDSSLSDKFIDYSINLWICGEESINKDEIVRDIDETNRSVYSSNAGIALIDNFNGRDGVKISDSCRGIGGQRVISRKGNVAGRKGIYYRILVEDFDKTFYFSTEFNKISPNVGYNVANSFSVVALTFGVTDWGPGNGMQINSPSQGINIQERLAGNEEYYERAVNNGYIYIAFIVYSATVNYEFDCDIALYYYLDGKVVANELTKELRDRLNLKEEQEYIVCWGDSLTALGGWTTRLQELSGVVVYNAGVGGENVVTISSRQGADAMVVDHLVIPASNQESVVVATRASGGINTVLGGKSLPLLQGVSGMINPCKIGDIEGSLLWTGTNHTDSTGTWVFKRNVSGDQVSIERPTIINTVYDQLYNSPSLMIIFMGQNGGYSSNEDLINRHRLMIEHSSAKKFIILGLSTGSEEQRKQYETDMRREFGRYFISLREYLAHPIYNSEGDIISCYGLADQGLAPEGNDLEDIEVGRVPLSLLTDSTHFKDGTKRVIGDLIYSRCKELNIF